MRPRSLSTAVRCTVRKHLGATRIPLNLQHIDRELGSDTEVPELVFFPSSFLKPGPVMVPSLSGCVRCWQVDRAGRGTGTPGRGSEDATPAGTAHAHACGGS